ncbi:MAG: peroxiredoxin [Bryobacteraceae bacterium]
MFSWLFGSPLAAGEPAPEFALPDESGNVVRLSELRGKNVILVFYPADETRICTKQLCEFRDGWEQVRGRNAVVYGVNPRGGESHAKFRAHHALPFPLLIDRGQRVAALYRSNGIIVRRTVYLIGPDGRIRYSRRGKPPVDEVLRAAG